MYINILLYGDWIHTHMVVHYCFTVPEILNGAHWSKRLDAKFKENQDKYHSLKWQYFCSKDGFFRVYPGLFRRDLTVLSNILSGCLLVFNTLTHNLWYFLRSIFVYKPKHVCFHQNSNRVFVYRRL